MSITKELDHIPDTAEVRDYSLLGRESNLAVERGLSEATWYATPVPRDKMKELLIRKNGPAVKDTVIWFTLIFASGFLFFVSWGHWWLVFPYFCYCTLYASSSDSRWHESGHGTAFKSVWMNNVLYEIASFMVFRQSIPWRWSHIRHHSDTIIRGRDPEIAVPRPPDIKGLILQLFALKSTPQEFRKMVRHAFGRMDPVVACYVPKSEYPGVFLRARIYLFIYATVIALSIISSSILPLMFIGFPTFFGSWLLRIYGTTQHAGLAENVLDHRLNSRTIYMNGLNRYLYWNMNYHLDHHLFPLVPYHALPDLHELIKHDCPAPYKSILEAYREIIPTLLRQRKDTGYYVRRELPSPSVALKNTHHFHGSEDKLSGEWIEVCEMANLPKNEILRFDFRDKTYAVYHTPEDLYYATDGICTHGNTHLADGYILGEQIECPKHNGRFSMKDGSARRHPACVGLGTYPVMVRDRMIYLNIHFAGGTDALKFERPLKFKVTENKNVTTFIRELVLEQVNGSAFPFTPGDYLQIEIPPYEGNLRRIQLDEPYNSRWQEENVFECFARNPIKTRRNYSIASNPETESRLKFNVRLSLPPAGVNCSAGIGSTYIFNLKPGDILNAYGPFGDFHIRDSRREMVYVGGGAGMAPIVSHISYLFDTLKTERKVSYWYGARSKSELYYHDYFESLAENHGNFEFHVALSQPSAEDHWTSFTGNIDQVLRSEFFPGCEHPEEPEFYLCGPPVMIRACLKVLKDFKVNEEQVSFDEF